MLSSLGRGGQERVAFDLCMGMKTLGVHSEVITLEDGEPGSMLLDFQEAGIDVHHFPKGDGFDIKLVFELGRFFRNKDVDVVHTHNPQPLIYAAGAGRAAGACVVHTKHGMNPGGGRSLWIRKAAARACHGFVSVSKKTQDVAESQGEVSSKSSYMIENGIDTTRFLDSPSFRNEVRQELGIPVEAFCVGTIGRLWPEKDHEFLVRALADQVGENFQLLIVGAGPLEEKLRDTIRDLGIEPFVHLPGLRRDVPRMLGALDLFVLTSVREGLPLVIPEAMSAGLPVVATDVGGIHRVVLEGETGRLIQQGDSDAFVDAVLECQADSKLRDAWGQRGKELAFEQFSVVRMAKDYYQLYEQLK